MKCSGTISALPNNCKLKEKKIECNTPTERKSSFLMANFLTNRDQHSALNSPRSFFSRDTIFRSFNLSEQRSRVPKLSLITYLEDHRYKSIDKVTEEHEESPDLFEMNVYKRNAVWDTLRKKKKLQKANAKKSQEMEKCTFKPTIYNVPSQKSRIMYCPKRQKNYIQLYRDKLLHRAQSIGKN